MDILTEYSTQIFVALILMFQSVLVAYLKNNSDKNIRELVEENKEQHKEINVSLSKLLNYYNLNIQEEEYFKQMHQNKDFFCSELKSQELRDFALYRANLFIDTVCNIVKTYDMQINNAKEIEATFMQASSCVKSEMKNRFNTEFVDSYYEFHNKLINKYLHKTKNILLDLENHHQDRFLKITNEFMIKSINELKEYEDVAELHWIG